MDDHVRAVRYLIDSAEARGPFNVVAPEPVRNADFARTLGRVLDRPALLPLPAVALRAALGELADESLLGGARVVPDRLIGSGYRFRQGTLEPALRHLLGRQGTA
jgi:NAD dependent epimerase/dehydratase family enzyme